MIKAAILGYGNIGSGVVSVLMEHGEQIARQVGDEVVPVRVLDLRDFPGDIMEDKVVRDIHEICDDPEIAVVVETMGGVKPAYDFVKLCLEAGKHVATSNKELVAACGEELLQIAGEHQAAFLFEASVGGAIPIIRPLVTSITADDVNEITGILNGTTNFMLTGMAEKGCAYEEILKEAQERGYAERNPAADVEGYDACRKIAILTSLAFGQWADYRDISTEGITAVTKEDMACAKKLGMAVKLLGSSRRENGRVYARVSPALIPDSHPLYLVSGVMNAVLVRGSLMGDLMFYGAGAGKLPTATAVVSDVIAALKYPLGGELISIRPGRLEIADAGEEKLPWFVRVEGKADGALLTAFGAESEVYLKECGQTGLITVPMSERELKALTGVWPVLGRLRVSR